MLPSRPRLRSIPVHRVSHFLRDDAASGCVDASVHDASRRSRIVPRRNPLAFWVIRDSESARVTSIPSARLRRHMLAAAARESRRGLRAVASDQRPGHVGRERKRRPGCQAAHPNSGSLRVRRGLAGQPPHGVTRPGEGSS